MAFDPIYYTKQNSDVVSSGLDPVVHYLTKGWEEGRSSSQGAPALSADEMMKEIIAFTPAQMTSTLKNVGMAELLLLDVSSSFDLNVTLTEYFGVFKNANPDEIAPLVTRLDNTAKAKLLGNLKADELTFLDGANNFDMGATLNAMDTTALAGVMGKWGAEQMGTMDKLASFDLGKTLNSFSGDQMKAMTVAWNSGAPGGAVAGGTAQLDLIAGLSSFDFNKQMTATGNPDLALGMLARMDVSRMSTVLGGLDSKGLAFIDGAKDFDLSKALSTLDAGMLSNVMGKWDSSQIGYLDNLGGGFNSGTVMNKFSGDQMKSVMTSWSKDATLLSAVANNTNFDFSGQMAKMGDANLMGSMTNMMGATQFANTMGKMDATSMAVLGGAKGFDLGAKMTAMDTTALAGVMGKWGAEQMGTMDKLASFDLGTSLNRLDSAAMGTVMGKWTDPNVLTMVAGLNNFSLGNAVTNLGAEAKGAILGTWTPSMISGLEKNTGLPTAQLIADAGKFVPGGATGVMAGETRLSAAPGVQMSVEPTLRQQG